MMKRIDVDQVARALVRFGIVLTSVVAVFTMVRALPIWG